MERRNNLLFLVLIATVGVLVAAILLGGSGDPGEPVARQSASQAEQTPGEVSARAAGMAGATGEQEELGTRQEIAVAAPLAGGPVVLSGRLVDQASSPAAGVQVRFRAAPRDGVFFMSTGDAGEGEEGGVRTGPDGRFAIQVEPGRAGRLVIPRSADRLFAAAEKRSFEVAAMSQSTDLGDIPVTSACAIAGRVVDEAGQPIAGAKVRSLLGGGGSESWFPMLLGRPQSVEVGADGRFVIAGLEPGEVTLGAEAKGFVPATEKVEIRTAERREDLVVVLARGASIAGVVVDDRGVPIAGAKVGVERTRELAPGVQFQSVDTDSQVETDENGYFMVSGVEQASASLIAEADGHAKESRRDIELGDGNVVFRLERLGRITGVLLDTEGRPLAGSQISVPGREVIPVDTDAEGKFTLEDVRPGSVSLQATGDKHLPVEGYTLHVVAGATLTDVTLRAETGAVLAATVVDASGQPVSGAQVRVRSVPAVDTGPSPAGMARAVARSIRLGGDEGGAIQVFDGSEELRRAKTDANGVARISGLPTGPVRVSASGKADAPARPVDLTIPRRGTVETILSLRPAGRVRVRVEDAMGEVVDGARFSVRGPEGGAEEELKSHRGTTDATGAGEVGPLLEGSYSVVLELEEKPAMFGGDGGFQFVIGGTGGGQSLEATRQNAQVLAGSVAEVVLRKPLMTRVHGVILGADGPAAGVRVSLQKSEPGLPGMLGGAAGALLGGGGGPSATTGADGTYSIEDVAEGSYTVEWGKPNQPIRDRGELVVPSGVADLRHDLELRVGAVALTVVDQDGNPIAGAEVTISRTTGSDEGGRGPRMMVSFGAFDAAGGGGGLQRLTLGSGGGRVETDAQGRARIDDVPPGEYRLAANAEGHAEGDIQPVVVVAGVTQEAGVLTLAAAGVLEGTVRDIPAGGIEGLPGSLALVELRAVGAELPTKPEIAQNGRFRIEGLAPGAYEVRARPMGGPGRAEPAAGAWVPVQITAGDVTTVELSAAGR
ncbi:MAG: carboxypeptidase-like regulatory domain-containing protein [Planctomycetota bacterium]|nr:carboxypeptidase-like regulatory domain-containing protein [Planctomycetota bacterium]